MWRDFRNFILRGNVVDLAIAVVIGAAFGAVVSAFTRDFLTPLIALIGGQPDFSHLSFRILGTTFPYGDFLNALLSFIIIATVVFFAVVLPINKIKNALDNSKKTENPSTKKCPYCLSEIPHDAKRCPSCTSWFGKHADEQ